MDNTKFLEIVLQSGMDNSVDSQNQPLIQPENENIFNSLPPNVMACLELLNCASEDVLCQIEDIIEIEREVKENGDLFKTVNPEKAKIALGMFYDCPQNFKLLLGDKVCLRNLLDGLKKQKSKRRRSIRRTQSSFVYGTDESGDVVVENLTTIEENVKQNILKWCSTKNKFDELVEGQHYRVMVTPTRAAVECLMCESRYALTKAKGAYIISNFTRHLLKRCVGAKKLLSKKPKLQIIPTLPTNNCEIIYGSDEASTSGSTNITLVLEDDVRLKKLFDALQEKPKEKPKKKKESNLQSILLNKKSTGVIKESSLEVMKKTVKQNIAKWCAIQQNFLKDLVEGQHYNVNRMPTNVTVTCLMCKSTYVVTKSKGTCIISNFTRHLLKTCPGVKEQQEQTIVQGSPSVSKFPKNYTIIYGSNEASDSNSTVTLPFQFPATTNSQNGVLNVIQVEDASVEVQPITGDNTGAAIDQFNNNGVPNAENFTQSIIPVYVYENQSPERQEHSVEEGNREKDTSDSVSEDQQFVDHEYNKPLA